MSSAVSSVTKVGVYGDEDALSNITYIEAKIDIDDLNSDKTFSVTLTKPSGVRYMTEVSTNVDIKLETESSKEFAAVPVESINLGNGYSVTAVTEADKAVTVIAKGVPSVLNSLDASQIKAYIDLSGYTAGTYDVDLKVSIDDVRVTLVPKQSTIKVKIVAK
jgi:YbbR domain-containing protein